jgi:hypothetical protein
MKQGEIGGDATVLTMVMRWAVINCGGGLICASGCGGAARKDLEKGSSKGGSPFL